MLSETLKALEVLKDLMGIESLRQTLIDKYDGFVTGVRLEYVEEKRYYTLVWRAWRFKSLSGTSRTYTTERFTLIIAEECMANEGIECVFPNIDKTVHVTACTAQMLKGIQAHSCTIPLGCEE